MKIGNFEELATTQERRDALDICEAGLQAVDTRRVIEDKVKLVGQVLSVAENSYDLSKFDDVYLVGIGKCSANAARVIEELLGPRIKAGVVIDVCDPANSTCIQYFKGSHPLPTEENIEATGKIIGLLTNATKKDLVLAIVSGGGSTLLCKPESHTCLAERDLVAALNGAGATIKELNTVRKHISLARGGYLAKYAYPAKLVSLIFSDVPGDDLQFISSGPTVRDKTTVLSAEKILAKYGISDTAGIGPANLIETPKERKYFNKVDNFLILSNVTALTVMKDKAKELGYIAEIVTSKLVGLTQKVARKLIREIRERASGTVLLYGGETTVIVQPGGNGGRNREVAMRATQGIRTDELVISIASDGADNGSVAGAIADVATKQLARKSKMKVADYVVRSDSGSFFEGIGQTIVTGNTGSNVSDLFLSMKSKTK